MTNRQAAIRIIKRLRNSGFEALLAGGCVRDTLLSQRAKDYDVATNAHPADIIKLFKHTLKIGAKFGVVMVLIDGQQIEVATFRSESGYVDGRHPTAVRFVDARADASRRDFTINGMFYDPIAEKVIDYVNGQADLKAKLVRTIGNPGERFNEDYLRMLRAIRFSTQLGFTIEPRTWSAICNSAENITKISGERIAMELEAILTNPRRVSGTSQLIRSGLAQSLFPDFSAKQAELGVEVLGYLAERIDFALALAGLFAGCQTEFAIKKCATLKLSRSQNRHIKFLLANRGKLLDSEMSLAQLKMTLAEPYFRDLYELQRAIQKASKKTITPLMKIRKRIKALAGQELRPKPLLNGHELIRLGATPGPQVGQLAREMYIAQLEGKLQASEDASRWVQKWLKKHRATGK